MCGIVGWHGCPIPEQERLPRLEAMCDAIRHRGPDDSGFFADDVVGLGMRRLSIVDLAGGHQPMSTPDGRFHIVFNGEIYNHAELRHGLRDSGVGFRTSSDTEVILRLFEREGIDCLHHLNGMFAIAVWDSRQRRLTLARDRMGVKPLYYHQQDGRFLFASEIKAMLASGLVQREMNPRAVWDYLTFRYVPAPETIWRSVFKLPPGHYLEIGPDGENCGPLRYWDIPYGYPPRPGDDAEFLQEFKTLLADAVDLRMLADVPVGITLSGGLDSSVVAALASRRHTGVKTFSVSFEGSPETDERPFARLVAQHLGTDHHEVVIGRREFVDFLPDMVHFTDEPLADLASVPLYHVCRLARGSVKVVLSGEGSDEILAGYDFERWAERWDREAGRPSAVARALSRCAAGFNPALALRLLHAPDLREQPAPLNMTNAMSGDEKRALLRDPDSWPDSLDGLRAALGRMKRDVPLHQALYCYCQDWLVEDLLMKADRMSMATSIELRTPFLDYRVVEWAARTPARLKTGPASHGVFTSKIALRRLARDILPREIIERPKQGFPVPVYGWLSSELRPMCHDLLLGAHARCADWFDAKETERLVAAGTSPQAPMPDRHRLWHLLILEIWMRRWLS